MFFALLFANHFAGAQVTQDYAVQLTATTQVSPPKITLSWRRITIGTPVYSVFRKSKTATSWGTSIAIIPTTDSIYTDTALIVDSAYEYEVLANSSTLISSGYIYAGIKAPAIHNRGALVMLVDSTFTDSCASGLQKLMQDISGDGWQLIRHDVSRFKPDTAVKALITHDYATHPNLKAVLIVGHVAVPYSGDQNPDGHPDHLGAWPADCYYGNITGVWTDVSVNDMSAGYPLNQNIPGDGKWDAVVIPSPNTLQVSRIDFYNMPLFTSTEVQMMRRYLAKDHVYKMDSLGIRKRALISDNFGAFSGEAFAANGWRIFPPMVSADSVSAVPFISSLAGSSYQWAYGCGGGTFTSAGGVGSTSDFASNPVQGIFTMLFGSYFGDWNAQNNFLRAPLCADTPALTSCWAGRPNWFLHHMAIGENIGYGQLLTQNNTSGLYGPANYGAGMVHIALMGDLTLRTDYIKPPANLTVTPTPNHGAALSWTASPDAAVIGYYVYRTDSAWGVYQKISTMLTAPSFTDTVGTNGLKYYMVRPVKLQTTPSGGYYNLGIGITDTATVSYPVHSSAVAAVMPEMGLTVWPNPAHDNLLVKLNTSTADVVTMYVVNISGEQFYPVTKQLNPGENTFSLNIADLPPGIYTLCAQSEGRVVTARWIKL